MYFPGARPVKDDKWIHSMHVIHVFPRDAKLLISEWSRAIRVAHSVRKTFILAIPGTSRKKNMEIDFVLYHRKHNGIETPGENTPRFCMLSLSEDEYLGGAELSADLEQGKGKQDGAHSRNSRQGDSDHVLQGKKDRTARVRLRVLRDRLDATIIDIYFLTLCHNSDTMETAAAVKPTITTRQDTHERTAALGEIILSSRPMNMFTAVETYRGRSTPTNLDVDAHLRVETRMPYFWIIGTGIVYTAPKKEFGSYVRFDGLVFEVPSEYHHLKDTALILQGHDLEINRSTGIFRGEVTHVVENLPSYRDMGLYYGTDLATAIPQTKGASPHSSSNSLFRINGSYVGIVVRGSGALHDHRSVVFACYRPSSIFRVAEFRQDDQELTIVPAPSILTNQPRI